ncbi:hypothetical protein RIF29_32584 [Crotalaria pallida]|uniref:Uncharacterized protein n=1 Tax=Crotalaria pallida TaxID=3830 RepID=A0AAN9ENJ7_CROPI
MTCYMGEEGVSVEWDACWLLAALVDKYQYPLKFQPSTSASLSATANPWPYLLVSSNALVLQPSSAPPSSTPPHQHPSISVLHLLYLQLGAATNYHHYSSCNLKSEPQIAITSKEAPSHLVNAIHNAAPTHPLMLSQYTC